MPPTLKPSKNIWKFIPATTSTTLAKPLGMVKLSDDIIINNKFSYPIIHIFDDLDRLLSEKKVTIQ